MAAEEKVLLQKYIEKGYDLFTKRCAFGYLLDTVLRHSSAIGCQSASIAI